MLSFLWFALNGSSVQFECANHASFDSQVYTALAKRSLATLRCMCPQYKTNLLR